MSDPTQYIGKRYRNGQSYLTVVGYIDQPALLLRDPVTGERMTVVIGCPNHSQMEEVSEADALEIMEGAALTGRKSVKLSADDIERLHAAADPNPIGYHVPREEFWPRGED